MYKYFKEGAERLYEVAVLNEASLRKASEKIRILEK
jgi:hypothetical protein